MRVVVLSLFDNTHKKEKKKKKQKNKTANIRASDYFFVVLQFRTERFIKSVDGSGVTIEEILDSSTFTSAGERRTFRLGAVVNHIGTTFTSGHYTASLRLEKSADDGLPGSSPTSWVWVDDLWTKPMSPADVSRLLGSETAHGCAASGSATTTSTPYLLFYVHEKISKQPAA
jgi:hypothetical protein